MNRRVKSASVVSNLLHGAAGNLLMPLSSVITGPLIARALDPAGRGAMAAVSVPISFANLLFVAGLPDALTFYAARRRIGRGRSARRCVTAGIAVGAVATVVMIALGPEILRKYHSLLIPYCLLAFTLIPSVAFAALRGILTGFRKFQLIFGERLLATLLRTAAIVVFVATGMLTATNAAAITVVAAVVASLILLGGWRHLPYPEEAQPTRNEIARFTGSAAIGTLGSVLVLRLDQTMMAPLTTATELGYYAVAVSLAELPLALTGAVRDVVFAVSSEVNDPRYAARACRQTNLIMLLVCGIGCLLAPFALPLLFGESFRPSIMPTIVLLAGTMISSTSGVLSGGLMVAGRRFARSMVMLGGAVVTVPLLFVLVPRAGALGAAIASSATYAVLAISMTALFSRTTGIAWYSCVLPAGDDVRMLAGFVASRGRRFCHIPAVGRHRAKPAEFVRSQ